MPSNSDLKRELSAQMKKELMSKDKVFPEEKPNRRKQVLLGVLGASVLVASGSLGYIAGKKTSENVQSITETEGRSLLRGATDETTSDVNPSFDTSVEQEKWTAGAEDQLKDQDVWAATADLPHFQTYEDWPATAEPFQPFEGEDQPMSDQEGWAATADIPHFQTYEDWAATAEPFQPFEGEDQPMSDQEGWAATADIPHFQTYEDWAATAEPLFEGEDQTAGAPSEGGDQPVSDQTVWTARAVLSPFQPYEQEQQQQPLEEKEEQEQGLTKPDVATLLAIMEESHKLYRDVPVKDLLLAIEKTFHLNEDIPVDETSHHPSTNDFVAPPKEEQEQEEQPLMFHDAQQFQEDIPASEEQEQEEQPLMFYDAQQFQEDIPASEENGILTEDVASESMPFSKPVFTKNFEKDQ